jgi:hypothetical protein
MANSITMILVHHCFDSISSSLLNPLIFVWCSFSHFCMLIILKLNTNKSYICFVHIMCINWKQPHYELKHVVMQLPLQGFHYKVCQTSETKAVASSCIISNSGCRRGMCVISHGGVGINKCIFLFVI